VLKVQISALEGKLKVKKESLESYEKMPTMKINSYVCKERTPPKMSLTKTLSKYKKKRLECTKDSKQDYNSSINNTSAIKEYLGSDGTKVVEIKRAKLAASKRSATKESSQHEQASERTMKSRHRHPVFESPKHKEYAHDASTSTKSKLKSKKRLQKETKVQIQPFQIEKAKPSG